MSATNIYDYESAVETAVETVLTAAGLTVYTPATALVQQKDRARVEVIFQTGAAKKGFHVVSGSQRNASWKGTLTVAVVTGMLMSEHREVRATVRNALALPSAITAAMTYHVCQDISEQGTAPTYKSDDGYFISTLTFTVDFGVHADAWEELTT